MRGRDLSPPAIEARTAAALLAALLAVWMFAACAPASAPPAAPAPAPPAGAPSPGGPAAGPAPTAAPAEPPIVPIKISYTVPGGIYTPLYVAETKGIYRKHGLDAELLLGGTGARTAQALVGGDVQFASTGSLTVSILQGSELVYVAGSANYFVRAI
jgi:ABC-type nitrate/sulfonate/bicarbonate transport system substrate-binding protein